MQWLMKILSKCIPLFTSCTSELVFDCFMLLWSTFCPLGLPTSGVLRPRGSRHIKFWYQLTFVIDSLVFLKRLTAFSSIQFNFKYPKIWFLLVCGSYLVNCTVCLETLGFYVTQTFIGNCYGTMKKMSGTSQARSSYWVTDLPEVGNHSPSWAGSIISSNSVNIALYLYKKVLSLNQYSLRVFFSFLFLGEDCPFGPGRGRL